MAPINPPSLLLHHRLSLLPLQAGAGNLTLPAAPLPSPHACDTLLCLHLRNQHWGAEPVIALPATQPDATSLTASALPAPALPAGPEAL